MKTRHIIATLLLVLVAMSSSRSMAQATPPIPIDEAVRIGHLNNGLTYYIRHNDYPEHRVNFYIAQRVGTMQEDDSQQGLAHFLEHMAFNGSEHFPGLGIVEYTRSLGLTFGLDLNAGTSFTRTVYNIDNVPSTRQSALDSCLLILKDWSHGLLLEDKDIDEERGVIHQEWRQTTDPTERMNTRQLARIFPDSKYGQRMIIGLMDIVDNFPYQVLRDYYHKWYRPDNQALVIVGDVDVDYTERKIVEMFNDIPAPAAGAAQVVPYPVPDNEEPIIVVEKDKEQNSSMLMVMFKHDAVEREVKSTLDYLLIDYARDIISAIMNERLHDLAQDPACPFNDSYCYDGPFMWADTKDALTMLSLPKEGHTEATLQALVTECRRAVEHGFTAGEYARAQQEYMSALERRYNDRDKVSNSDLAKQYYNHYLQGEPIPSIEQLYQFMSSIVPQFPVEGINQLLGQLVDTSGRNLVVINYNNEKDGAVYPTEQGLKAAIVAGQAAPVEALTDDVQQAPLLSQLPKAGKIVSESENTQLGYKELLLSNGARVVIKKTDFKQDEVLLQAMQRGGKSLYGEQDWANLTMINGAMATCGLGELSNNELTKALAGKQVSVSATMSDFFDAIQGSSTIKDLETLFQLTYLNFTDRRKDEKAFAQLMNITESRLKSKDQVPENVMNERLEQALFNNDWRHKPFNASDLQQVDLDRIMHIAQERTANAAGYTFYLVGNIDEATVRPLIEQYIASLPSSSGTQDAWANVISHPVGEHVINFDFPMETPKTLVNAFWYDTTMPCTLETGIRAKMLGNVLGKVHTQLIREDAGAAYSTLTMGYSTLEGDNSFTAIMAYCPVKPEFTQQTLDILDDQLKAAAQHIDEASLTDVKNEMIKDHESKLKENGYWLQVLINYVELGVDNVTGFIETVKAQTPATVASLARQLSTSGSKVEVVMTPKQ